MRNYLSSEAYSNANNDALKQIRKFNENFVKFESDIAKRIHNLQCWKCSVKLVVRSPHVISRHIFVSQTIMIESLLNFLKEKIVTRLYL